MEASSSGCEGFPLMATPIEMECVRRRPFPVDRVLARCSIVVDGRVVARLREGSVQVEHVPPGPHRIEARTVVARSRELSVTLADGEPVRILVERRGAGWPLGRHRQHEALDLRLA